MSKVRPITQMQVENICYKIEGYFIRGNERKSNEKCFDDAKAELLGHLLEEVQHMKDITYDKFKYQFNKDHPGNVLVDK